MRKKILCALLAVSMVVSSGTMLPNTQAVTASAASTSVSPFTGKTYTHSDVFHGKNVYHGIDVSYHNGAIDWAKAAADGVEYAFIRVGYRGWGSGTVVEDPRFETYIMPESMSDYISSPKPARPKRLSKKLTSA